MSRYMLIMRSTPEAETAMAEQNIDFDQIIESMGRFNEELIKAGVLLAGEGLTGPEEGFVVDFNSDPPVVTDGPYTEAKELFNGFWILDVSSKEEAKQWARRVPLGRGVKLEVRRVSDTEEFPADNPWVQKEISVAGRTRREDRGAGAGGRGQLRSRRALARGNDDPDSLGGADPDGSAPVGVRVDHVAALGDLHIACLRQVTRGVAGLVHQVAPVVAADRPGRIRGTDALRRPAFTGHPQDRVPQSLLGHVFEGARFTGP